ncbi:antibiotic biosynthesis monooxygenase family protein [Sorangium sp. So ce321]|uniref:antibiotic biosynthesis monooxygenase family protein n=1 Tax=Sorangium sp. So ce321 TaxID=3133300 RepID=UPI003F5E88BB
MVTISPHNSVQTVIVRLVVEPSRAQELLEQLDEYMNKVVKRFPGFVSSTLHHSEDSTRIINYVQWESLSAYRKFLVELRRNTPAFFRESSPETMPFEIVKQYFPPYQQDEP